MTSPNDDTWYRDGLRFRCTQCGNCCTGGEGAVWVTAEEMEAIAEHLGKPVGEVRWMDCRKGARGLSLREHTGGDCVYLDPRTRGCTVYPVRPRQCRTWPFWNSNLRTEEDWKRTQEGCPGAGQGDLHDADEIRRRAAVIDL